MSAASDRARFHLEQTVPQLQEFSRKGIFTREEIRAIASKRSAFEHTINATGPKSSDYARYITYEMNLDALRRKRSKRLGIKNNTAFNGQRTVFRLLDRATKKFPGDVGLWLQYIRFCQQQKAHKKLEKVLTQVLRLKPREWGLWVLAAKFYAEERGDVSAARAYMQRGLRFCRNEVKLWLEFVRLEMGYLAKIAERRKVLGLDEVVDGDANEQAAGGDEGGGEDMIMLPAVTVEEMNSANADNSAGAADSEALQQLSSTPALNGALPITIFDAAMKQFQSNKTPKQNPDEIANSFFDLVSSFENQVPVAQKILQHILSHLQTTAPNSPEAITCEARLSLFVIDPLSAEFPSALGNASTCVKNGVSRIDAELQDKLAEEALRMLIPYLTSAKVEQLDDDVVKVLEASVRRYLRIVMAQQKSTKDAVRSGTKTDDALARMLDGLRGDGRDGDAKLLEEYCRAIAVL